MTDFHSMSDSELNEWIARRKYNKRPDMWLYPHDYCNDWSWAGELEEEGKFALMYNDHLKTYLVFRMDADFDCDGSIGISEIPTRAIAEAYAVMMESMTKTDSSITVDDTGKDGEG